IPTGTPGFTAEPAYDKVGWNSSDTHPLTFDNVQVPEANLLGERGRGYANFLRILDEGRIAVGALSVGAAQGCVDESVKYAKERQAFGKPISDFQGISFKIARMEARVVAARSAYYLAASRMLAGLPFKKEAAIAKMIAGEAAMDNARDATQIHGGYGFMNEFLVARHYRDSKILEIGEGTTEVQLMLIARELGLLPRGPRPETGSHTESPTVSDPKCARRGAPHLRTIVPGRLGEPRAHGARGRGRLGGGCAIARGHQTIGWAQVSARPKRKVGADGSQRGRLGGVSDGDRHRIRRQGHCDRRRSGESAAVFVLGLAPAHPVRPGRRHPGLPHARQPLYQSATGADPGRGERTHARRCRHSCRCATVAAGPARIRLGRTAGTGPDRTADGHRRQPRSDRGLRGEHRAHGRARR